MKSKEEIRAYWYLAICTYRVRENVGVFVSTLEDYCSFQLLSYSISSGALGSPGLLLSHPVMTLAY